MINYNLKFKSKDRDYHFISDLHYNHDRDFIWGAPGRKYKNVTEMDNDIIFQWNSVVKPDDYVFHLGDIIFRDWDSSNLLKLYDRLNFKKLYCIFGNHTSGERTLYKAMMEELGFPDKEMYPLELDINSEKQVIFLGYRVDIEIDDQIIVLDHYPIESWDKQRRKTWHLHGHCHRNLKDTTMKRIDVGWDYINRPISYRELIPIMRKRNGMSGDHHKS